MTHDDEVGATNNYVFPTSSNLYFEKKFCDSQSNMVKNHKIINFEY